ncbi:MAG: TonB-dependent receptor plug domain-containing protein, partial [Candidatus Anammoxibacter sp.]
DKDLKNELAWLQAETYVSIATKNAIKVSKAPSVITVITEEQIEHMNLRRLTDALALVPGFDIIQDGSFGRHDTNPRGVRDSLGSDKTIKLLLDGHSLNMPFNGGFSYHFDDLPLQNVKRIEIIRGPGSALYGANAFFAVINVVTKDASDIDGIKVRSGFGSFDTQEYSIQFGKSLYGVDITGFADFYNTNGQSDTIKEDKIFGAPFAQSPGDTDDGRKRLDTYFKLSYKDIEFKAKYLNKDTEPFVGSSFNLTDDGESRFNYVMGELNYKLDIGERLTIRPRVYYDQYDIEFLIEPFPDGFVIPVDIDGDGDIEEFPDGVLANLFLTNRRLGSEIQIDYKLFDNNLMTWGFDYKWERQDNLDSHANFNPLNSASVGALQSSVDFNKRVYRQIWAVYFQDNWDITDNLAFTFGIRHDHYSDFEGTTNPRLGLVWDFYENATLKLLYGQAFRAPTFSELYGINNPSLLGNSDLKPETVRTYEFELGYKFTDWFSAKTNYFFNVIRNRIKLSDAASDSIPTFENQGGANVQGVEFEAKADLGRFWNNAYVWANYSYLDAEAKGDPLPDVPKHKGNFGVNFGITKYLNANLHTFVSGPRVRAEADTRDDSPGYAITNLTLIAKDFFKDMKIKASLFNLFDKKYDDPAPIGTVRTDLPRPGRTFSVQLEYEW